MDTSLSDIIELLLPYGVECVGSSKKYAKKLSN